MINLRKKIKKAKTSVILLLASLILINISALPQRICGNTKIDSYEKNGNVLIFKLHTGKLKLEFFTENIVRVVYTKDDFFSKRKSLSVIEKQWPEVKYFINELSNNFEIKTTKFKILLDKKSSAISFLDLKNNTILKEHESGRNIEKIITFTDTAYSISQKWYTENDEAIYGLGQYQYDVINWHNANMKMQQQNTAIAMPVVLSSKGYGIFWDNYSLTEYNEEKIPSELKAIDNNTLKSIIYAKESGEYSIILEKDEWNPIEVFMNDSLVYAHYAGVSYPTRVFKVNLQKDNEYKFIIKNIDKPIYPTISSYFLKYKEGNLCKNGLKAEFFDNINLSGEPVFVRADSVIDFDWGNGSPIEGFKTDAFSIRWTGKLIAPKSIKNVSVDVTTDDGVRLYINGKKVIDKWYDRGPQTDSYIMDIEEGKEYDIIIEYYENGGGAYARLSWSAEEPKNQVKFLDKVKMYYRTPEMGKEMSFKSKIADNIDYYYIYGENPDSIIHGIRTLTGKAPLYPKWAYGLFMSQYGWKDQKTIQNILDGYRNRNIPVDIIVQDMDYWPTDPKNLWGSHIFDSIRYPNPKEMIDYIHKNNAHIIISVWPRINQSTDVYDSMSNHGFLLAVQNTYGNKGEGIIIQDKSPNAAYDPFNPKARQMFWGFMKKRLFDKGIDGWWMDASEPEWGYDFSKAYTFLGSGQRYLNAYPLMSKKGIYEGQISTGSSKRPYILTRSSFVGQQRFATTTWSGDIGPDWTTFRKVIPSGLNYCITGMPYWTNDIGGFAVYDFVNSPQYPELLIRWFQYGTFLPIFRVHGCRYTPFWNYDEKTQNILRMYTNLRYRLMPYIYSLGAKVAFNDFTIHRALIMDFPNDKNVYNIQDQFMFGNEFLICPITYPSTKSRIVYLPDTKGGWYNFWTGERYSSKISITANAPINIIPIFVRSGSIIPMGPFIQYAMQSKGDTVELRIYPGTDGKFNLYEDEGDNFNYQQGKFSLIPLEWNDKNKTLIIGDRIGEYDGMIKNKLFLIYVVDKNNGVGIEQNKKPDKIIYYSGKKISTKFK